MIRTHDATGLLAQLANTTLTVYSRGRRVASTPVECDESIADLALLDDGVLLLDRDQGRIYFYDHALESPDVVEVEPSSRLLATSGAASLVSTPDGDGMVFSGGQLASLPRLRGATYACPRPDGSFYVGRGPRLEVVDVTNQRISSSFRLVLGFIPTSAGLISRGRFMWFSRAGHPLEVFRVSDWLRRPPSVKVTQIRSSALARFAAVQQPAGNWLLLDVEHGSEREVIGHVRDVAVLPGHESAIIIESLDGAVTWSPPLVIDEAALNDGPSTDDAEKVAAPPTAPSPQQRRAGISRWRAQLLGSAAVRAPEPPGSSSAVGTGEPTDAPLVKGASSAPKSVNQPKAPPAPPPSDNTWRGRLQQWDVRAGEPPALAGRLVELCERLGLAPETRRAVAYLYRRRLVGQGAASPARLAQIIGGPGGWREALGHGELAALGVIVACETRPTLSRAARRFLDEAPPEFHPLDGGAADAPVIAAPRQIAKPFVGATAEEAAALVAQGFACPLAWYDQPLTVEQLNERALEARLHGRVALLLVDEPLADGLSRVSHPVLVASWRRPRAAAGRSAARDGK